MGSQSLAGDANSIDALAAKPPSVSEIKAAGKSDLGNVQVQIVRPNEIKQNEQAEFEVQLTRSNGYQFLEGAGYNFVVVQGNKIVYEAAGISDDGTEFIAPTFHNGAARIFVVVYTSGALPQFDVSEDQKILNLKASKNAAVFDIDSVK